MALLWTWELRSPVSQGCREPSVSSHQRRAGWGTVHEVLLPFVLFVMCLWLPRTSGCPGLVLRGAGGRLEWHSFCGPSIRTGVEQTALPRIHATFRDW